MRARIKSRLTYANVMATIAVFAVLAGGGAYAASKVGPKDIKKNAVRSKHIKQNAVKAKQVQGKSVKQSLGIRSTGRVRVGAAVPPTQRVLARSGPITLVGTCEDIGGGGADGVLRLRSSTGSGSFIGVRYTDGAGGAEELTDVRAGLTEPGVILARAASFVGPLEAGASFTATVGGSTLSGEARTSIAVLGSCDLSFNGLAG